MKKTFLVRLSLECSQPFAIVENAADISARLVKYTAFLRDDIVVQVDAIPDEEITISGDFSEKVSRWPPSTGAILVDRRCRQADGDYLRAMVAEEDGKIILPVIHAVF